MAELLSNINPDKIEIFFLLFIRTLSLIIFLPVLGYQAVDMRVKIPFSLILSLSLTGLVDPQYLNINLNSNSLNLAVFTIHVINEIFFGIILGFLTMFIFNAFQFAGEMMSRQMGLSMLSMMDPTLETNISGLSKFQYIFLMLIFLLIGGHLFFIEALAKSIEIVPVGYLSYLNFGEIMAIFINNFTDLFVIGIKAGVPIVGSLFVVEAGLGVVARTAPQIHIFLVSIPLKIGVGFILLLLSFSFIISLFIRNFGEIQADFFKIIQLFKG